MTTIQRVFPHTCPGFRCAICGWVMGRKLSMRNTAKVVDFHGEERNIVGKTEPLGADNTERPLTHEEPR